MSATVKEFSKAWWSEVYNRIIGAAVYLDDASAECLHWDGGLFNLLFGGAVAVKNLSPFEDSSKEHKKGVFISQVTPTQLSTIKEIIKNSDFSHCILISCVSLDVVYLEMNEDKNVSDVIMSGRATVEATKQLEGMLTSWIGKQQSAVEVLHIPIFAISPTNDIFLTPPCANIFPLYNDKLVPSSQSIDLYSLNNYERSQLRRLASGLNSMLDSMNLKEDVYFMGSYSSLIAGVLDNSPVSLARRKNCSNPASLIIVDRTLDLSGVTSHTTDSVLDKIISVLQRFPGHSTDIAVDMSPICQANVFDTRKYAEDIQLSPGCLYHANDDTCVQMYDYMINKTQKEVMSELYNRLSNIDIQRSPGLKTLVKVTPQSFEKIISATKGNYEVISKHSGVIQQALGVVQMLNHPVRAKLELISSLQNQAHQSLWASRESTSLLHQVTHLIKTRKDRDISLENLLALLVHIYSLIGTELSFSKQHEDSLMQALSVALFSERNNIFAKEETSNISSPEKCEQIACDIISRLKDVAEMRKTLQRYNSVLKKCETGSGGEYKGVLQQLIDDLVDPDRPEMPDLRHRSDGLKNMLRSGFSMLTSKKPRNSKHPLDNPVVIIFIVGGTTAEECKRLHRRIITSGIDSNFMIGSTKFLSPQQAMRDCLSL